MDVSREGRHWNAQRTRTSEKLTETEANGKDDGLQNVDDLVLHRAQLEPHVVGVLLGGNKDVERDGRDL